MKMMKYMTIFLKKAIQGIDSLIETYKQTDKISIRQTLSLYKNILDMEEPSLFKDEKRTSYLYG